jgi:hypothetical protein
MPTSSPGRIMQLNATDSAEPPTTPDRQDEAIGDNESELQNGGVPTHQ